jgi:acetylornithine deacetylase/succinyl-diaminopimelate desuccinylase-like protein
MTSGSAGDGSTTRATESPADPISATVRDQLPQLHADLDAWLRIPSISADPAYAEDIRASAAWLVEALRRTGFPTVEVWETAGHPAVFAEWPSDDPAAPTVVLYGHHDVQPVDPIELWHSPPFEPTIRGEELFARGAIDDKGQVLFHLLGLRAHLETTGRTSPAVNLKLLVEGEEESGSAHFADLLRERRDRLDCDVVVVSDTSVFGRETPSICTGMRGLVSAQIDVHGPDIDLHSGSFGGAVPNPLTVLARLLAGLHDEHGHVTLPGFYDRVVPLTDRERELFARLPFDEEHWVTETAQSKGTAGEAGFTTLERLWARPTAEINGMWGGYTGPGGKTIVPTDAHAKVTFRMVTDQQPGEVLESLCSYVESAAPRGVTATVTAIEGGVRPCLTPLDHPALQAATRAMERAFGKEVLYTREGGSGPEADLAEILAAPVIFVGVGLPDDRIHAPNERVVLPMLEIGARAAAYLWEELAGMTALTGGSSPA